MSTAPATSSGRRAKPRPLLIARLGVVRAGGHPGWGNPDGHVPVARPNGYTIPPGTAVTYAGRIPGAVHLIGSGCLDAPERSIVGCVSNGTALPTQSPR